MWGGGSRDRRRSGQVRWAFGTEVWGGLPGVGLRDSAQGGTGSVLLYWSVGMWWAQDFHSAKASPPEGQAAGN